jgi:hypothetical protein
MGARPKYVAGDYNANGEVDAADYVVWRKNPDGFGGDPAGYNTWRTNFGQPSGSAATVGTSEAVPEPCGLLLVVSGVGVLVLLRGKQAHIFHLHLSKVKHRGVTRDKKEVEH